MAEANTSTTGAPSSQAGGEGKDGNANTSLTDGIKPESKEGTANEGEGKDGKKADDKGTEGTDKSTDKTETKDPVVPEKYELKLPEGVLVDEKLMTKFTGLAKEMKWDNATAQKMADMHLEAVSAFAEKQDVEHAATLLGWHNELIEDKELGGAKIDDTMKQARKVMTLAASIPGVKVDRLVNELNRTGLATHPDLVRMMHYFGQFIGEDNKFVKGSVTQPNLDAATIMYGPDGVKK